MNENGHARNVAIVGAGPAGLAAAATLSSYGVPTTLIDESHGLGGQYYKSYSAAPTVLRGRELDALYRRGMEKAAGVEGAGVEIRTDTPVWGFFEPNKLALLVDGRVEILEPTAILLASGAVERVAAFPGWTLPGVMTAGGAQRLLSHEGILPGSRFVLAGTGPLLLAIATEIAEAGGDVAAVVDCMPLTAPLRSRRAALGTIRQPGRFLDWVNYRNALRRMGIPYIHDATVMEAIGDGQVSSVRVAKKHSDWTIVPGSEQVIEADALCLHYGFAASTELAQVAGCDLAYDDALGGWHVRHDQNMRTSRENIFVAGQLTGIGGADLAEATGALAALGICEDFGMFSDSDYQRRAKPLRREVARGRSFADMLNLAYTPGPGIGCLIKPDTLICRCEEVSAAQIDAAAMTGASTANDFKRQTRCGMGLCQGRICSQVLSTYAACRHGIAPGESGVFNARVPLKPVPLSGLATIPDPESAPTTEGQ